MATEYPRYRWSFWRVLFDFLHSIAAWAFKPLAMLYAPKPDASLDIDAIGREAGVAQAKGLPFVAFIKRALGHDRYSGGGFLALPNQALGLAL